jgi:hypothetical protein
MDPPHCQRSPNARAKSELGRSALETDAIERQIVQLGVALLVDVTKRSRTVEDGGFLSKNFGVRDEICPFDGVQLLEVLQQHNPSVLILLPDNLTKRK